MEKNLQVTGGSDSEEEFQMFGDIRVKPWPEDAEEKDGFSLRSRNSKFKEVLVKFEEMFTKGSKMKLNNTKIKVLDKRSIAYGVEIEVDAVKDSVNGVVQIKVFSKSKRRESTVTVSKAKQSNNSIVEIVAKESVLPTLKSMLQGDDNKKIVGDKSSNNFPCEQCRKVFITSKNLKIHMSKSHKVVTSEESPLEVENIKPSKVVKFDIPNQNKYKEIEQIYNPTFKKIGLNAEDFLVLTVPGGGLCGANAVATHIFEDVALGEKVRQEINKHKVDHWDYYKVEYVFPYKASVGNGTKTFATDSDFLKFLQHDHQATYLWFSHGDLQSVANIYDTNVNVFTTGTPVRGPEENSARWTHIKPDKNKVSKDSAFLTSDIYLYHHDGIHFDLLVNKTLVEVKENRLSEVQDLVLMDVDEGNQNPIEHCRNCAKMAFQRDDLMKKVKELELELKTLKEERLKTADSSAKQNRDIRESNSIMYENDESMMSFNEESESDSSFERVRSKRKKQKTLKVSKHNTNVIYNGDTFQCNICKKHSDSNDDVIDHMRRQHNQDGDWLCNLCDFQTNKYKPFEKHIDAKHCKNDQTNFKCEVCGMELQSKRELNVHRVDKHNTFKPCRYFQQDGCKFGEHCRFKHIVLEKGQSICYVCGKLFNDINEMMNHRKQVHATVVCKAYIRGSCKFDDKYCWWSHAKPHENTSFQNVNNKMVFQVDPRSSAPPVQPQSAHQPQIALQEQQPGQTGQIGQAHQQQQSGQQEDQQVARSGQTQPMPVFVEELKAMRAQLDQVALRISNIEKSYQQ